MSAEHDGGPAYPQPLVAGPDGGINIAIEYGLGGMTLRDYFAAKAMAAHIARFSVEDRFAANKEFDKTMAKWAYAQADAMLEARKK